MGEINKDFHNENGKTFLFSAMLKEQRSKQRHYREETYLKRKNYGYDVSISLQVCLLKPCCTHAHTLHPR